jgi:Tol biopolymer transport system component
MPLQPDTLLNDRYRIQEIIAEGGMGAVYRAYDQSLQIQVALKENYHTVESFTRQFHREAALLAALNHPNLPRVTDYFVSPQDGQYLVMDFVEGRDLRQILAQDTVIAESEVVRLGAAVCEALEYLHTRRPPVVHRDVKPGNVKITPTGHVFLVDFGLAKQTAGGEATTTGAQALTPGYAPPEQYGQGTDPRSDVYALGATLYAALTGTIPADGLARAMGTADLVPVRAQAPQVSAAVAATVEKAMAVKPVDRFASAAEFRSALLASAGGAGESKTAPSATPERTGFSASSAAAVPTVARPSSQSVASALTPAAPEKKKLSAWIWLGGGVVAVALLAGALLAARAFKPGAALPSPIPASPTELVDTRTPAPTLTWTDVPATLTATAAEPVVPATPPASAPTDTPTAPDPAATPRGGSSLLAFSSDRGGIPQIWIMSPDGGAPEQITKLPDGACQPDWSPDGKQIVFTSPCRGRADAYPGSSLYTIYLNGTGLSPLPSLPGGDFDPAWSPDGTSIAFTSLRGGKPNIFLYDIASGKTKRLSNPVNYDQKPAWSPDGQWIAYETTATGQSQIWVMNAEGKNKSEFSPAAAGVSHNPAWSPDGSYILYTRGNDAPTLFSRAFPPKGNPEIRLSETLTGVDDARLAPDGWQLALTLYGRSTPGDIYLMAINGADLTRKTDSEGEDFHPAWQP